MSVLAAMADPSRKDVVVAVLGASAALGGFVLVFLGILISAYQSYPADTAKAVKERRRRAVWPVLGVFPLSIAGIALEDVRIVVEVRRRSPLDGQTVTGSATSWRSGFFGAATRA